MKRRVVLSLFLNQTNPLTGRVDRFSPFENACPCGESICLLRRMVYFGCRGRNDRSPRADLVESLLLGGRGGRRQREASDGGCHRHRLLRFYFIYLVIWTTILLSEPLQK